MTEPSNDLIILRQRIDELISQHGTLHATARVLMTDCGYLHRLRSGEKTEPSDDLLRRMGLRKVMGHVRRDAAMTAVPQPVFQVGDRVHKCTGEARYSGWIVAVYQTRKGFTRYVIEVDPQGFQMICTAGMLAKRPEDE